MKTSRTLFCAAAFCFAIGRTCSAYAGFTEAIRNLKEPDQKAILDHLLGGSFAASGRDFSNGTITAHRINDRDDEQFGGRTFEARAVARFSDYTQAFGMFDHGFEKMFDVTGNRYNVSGSAMLDHVTAFARSGDSGTDSSVDSDNADSRDHVMTFRIMGDGPDEKYLMFWEDLNMSPTLGKHRSPSDFNDLVIELTADTGNNGSGNLIPLPPAVASAAVTVIGGFVTQYLARRRGGFAR